MNIQIENYLALNIMDMLLVLISTFIIILIGKKFFWNTIVEYIQKRQDFLQNELTLANENKTESEKLLSEYKAQLADAKAQASEIVTNANLQASNLRDKMVKETKEEIIGMKNNAMAQIQQDKINAEKQIKAEISEIAFSAASKIIEKEINKEDYDKYVDEFIATAKEDKWQA